VTSAVIAIHLQAAPQPTPTSPGQPKPAASQLPDLMFTLAVGVISLVIVVYLLVRRYRREDGEEEKLEEDDVEEEQLAEK
jgi:hypothetical protein